MKPTYGLVPYTGICPSSRPSITSADHRERARQRAHARGDRGPGRHRPAPVGRAAQPLRARLDAESTACASPSCAKVSPHPACSPRWRRRCAPPPRASEARRARRGGLDPGARAARALTFPMLVEGTYAPCSRGRAGIGRFDLFVPVYAASRAGASSGRLPPLLEAAGAHGAHVDRRTARASTGRPRTRRARCARPTTACSPTRTCCSCRRRRWSRRRCLAGRPDPRALPARHRDDGQHAALRRHAPSRDQRAVRRGGRPARRHDARRATLGRGDALPRGVRVRAELSK